MIKLSLKDGSHKNFNLNDYETEKKLEAAWRSMTRDDKYQNKRFNITTDSNEKLSFLIGEIEDCFFDECTYVKAQVHTKKEETKKQEPAKDPYDAFMEKLSAKSKQRERQNIEKFFGILKLARVPIDMNDPFLLEVIENVKKVSGNDTFKIPMYANLYAKTKSK